MLCESCGVEAPTKYVVFHRNIGLLVVRFSNTIEGDFCKGCIHKYFWQFTLTNLVLGWWGIISFVLNVVFIINNVLRYLPRLLMPSVPAEAERPHLTDEAIDRLEPHTGYLYESIDQGDDFTRVVEQTALRANVTPGQVVLYLHALVAASEEQPAE